jgi:hypothetical protein
VAVVVRLARKHSAEPVVVVGVGVGLEMARVLNFEAWCVLTDLYNTQDGPTSLGGGPTPEDALDAALEEEKRRG